MRVAIVVLLLAGCGRIGFDSTFAFEQELTIHAAAGDEADVPILVVFDPSRVDYARFADGGRDLRFEDSLPYEIERWDPTGRSLVWVKVPRIERGEATIVALYGNPALPDGQDPAAVWSGHVAVLHLDETPLVDPIARDASEHGHGGAFLAMDGGAHRDSPLGGAMFFDGIDDTIEIADSEDLHVTSDFTLEGWVSLDTTTNFHTLISKDGATGADTDGAYGVFGLDDGSIEYETNNFNIPLGNIRGCCAARGVLNYFTITMASDGFTTTYLAGAPLGMGLQEHPMPVTSTLVLGRRGLSSVSNDGWLHGQLDEVRISPRARSADWIAIQYASMTDALITYGPAKQIY